MRKQHTPLAAKYARKRQKLVDNLIRLTERAKTIEEYKFAAAYKLIEFDHEMSKQK
jgi:hypothetical protein